MKTDHVELIIIPHEHFRVPNKFKGKPIIKHIDEAQHYHEIAHDGHIHVYDFGTQEYHTVDIKPIEPVTPIVKPKPVKKDG